MRSIRGKHSVQLVLSNVAMLLCLLTVGMAGAATPPLPGDPAPPMPSGVWLQKGAYDQVRPVDGRVITVVEFWASWDPLSRAVLPIHDKMQAELSDKGIRFLAISPEQPEDVRAYLKQSGLKNIAVACDEAEATIDAYFGPGVLRPIPFTVVVEDGPDTRGRVLWRGPAATREGAWVWRAGYRAALDDILAQLSRGDFDVRAARAAEQSREELVRLRDEIERSARAPNLDGLTRVGRELLGRAWPPAVNSLLVEASARAAWFLVSADQASRENGALGLELAEMALSASQEQSSSLTHVYARALFENGRLEDAVAAQRKAIGQPRTDRTFSDDEYRKALSRYEAALREADDQRVIEDAPAAPSPPEAASSKKEEEPVPPPEELSAEEAAQDLRALYDHLASHYVAYDDAGWRLAGSGSSWEEYNSNALRRITARDRWSLPDFLELLSEYFRVFPDRHLTIRATLPSDGTPRTRWIHPNRGVVPFFSDVRIREEDGRMILAAVPDDLSHSRGAVLLGVPVIASPEVAEPGRPYLFPTLPSLVDEVPARDVQEYLLGVLAEEAVAPAAVTVSVSPLSSDRPGSAQEAVLPLHRGRVLLHKDRKDPLWSLCLGPVPVVAVRRMGGEDLEEMPGSAVKVRGYPAVILDLRGNGGGSDHFAWEWCRRFTGQELRAFSGFTNIHPGEADSLRKWDSFLMAKEENPIPSVPLYGGQLVVVTDAAIGSSGETFTSLASQVNGALLVGENTAGCCSYGNLRPHFDLPNSRFRVIFTQTKAAVSHRPFREGFGFFPDYWLDTEDPVTAITEYISTR